MIDSGIIEITGEHDTGKTTMALEAVDPSLCVFVDDDVKGKATVEDMKKRGIEFMQYHDLVTDFSGKRELAKHDIVLKIIAGIPKEAKYVVWDTWTNSGRTCYNYVVANQMKFRDSWAAMGKIKAGELWQQTALYEAELLSRIADNGRLVLIVNHLKDHYLNQVPTGKYVPASSKAFDRICVARFWLRHNPASAVPIALVLKRVDQKNVVDNKIRTTCILPRKITPLSEEGSVWDVISRYYQNPIGLRKPDINETPNEEEVSILDGTLTEENMNVWRMAAIMAKETKEAEEQEALEAKKDAVKSMRDGGMTPAQIAIELSTTVPNILALLK